MKLPQHCEVKVTRNKSDVFYRLFKNKDMYLPALLCLGAFLTRFGFLALSDNFKGPQPMLNIITSLHIFKYPGIIQNIYYQQLPAFLYSLFAAIKIGGDQIISGRLLSVFWGSMSIAPYYYLVSKIFTKRIAVLSALLLCFYPVHVINSVITTPDIMGLFLLLSAMYCLQEQRNILAGVFVFLATACTYVSWLFVLILPIFIISIKNKSLRKRLKDAVWFFLIAGLFSLFWIIITNNVYKEHNLFYNNFFNAKSFYEYLFSFMSTVSMITRKLFFFPLPVLFLLGLAGIYQSAKTRKYYEFFFLIGALVLTLSLGIFREEIALIEQGMLVLSALLIPFMVLGLDFILHVFGLSRKIFSMMAITLISVSLLFLSMYERPYLPKKIRNLSSWIKYNVQDRNVKIYISEDKSLYFSSIIMLSGLPQGNFNYFEKDSIKLSEISRNKGSYLICSGVMDKSVWGEFTKAARFDEYWVLTGLGK